MEQLEKLRKILGIENTDEDALLIEYLNIAKVDILNKRYPMGYPKDPIELEPRYLTLQVDLAVVRYNMRGVEGQTQHSENGIGRHYTPYENLLRSVVPLAKCL